jgi:polyisoprenoid-binding protein YceI
MKKYARTVAMLLIGLVSVSVVRATERYEIDSAHAFVNFTIAHFAGKARGSFGEVAGTIIYDEQDVTKSSVAVTIKASSIHTGNAGRDTHLKSADFFDAAKFPEATFKSRRVEKRDGKYLAIGDLTLRGVTREVEMPFTLAGPIKDPLPTGVKRLMVEASLKIDRRDFGIAWNRVTEGGGLFVGNDVILDINVEAIVPKPKSN